MVRKTATKSIRRPGFAMAPEGEGKKLEVVADWLWDRLGMAESVDAFWRSSPDEIAHRKRLATLVNDHSNYGDSILEVGCGTGLIYGALKQFFGDVITYTGLDYSRPMLDIAITRYPEGTFRGGKAEALDYPDSWFDVACAFEVFGHSSDCAKAVKELIRVAKHTAIFTMWLGAGDAILQGTDHYEYPVKVVEAAITAATRMQNCTVKQVDLAYVAAFVIEKV